MEGQSLTYLEAYSRVIKVYPPFKDTSERVISSIRKYVDKDSLILDVGCGFGRAMRELAPFCKRIIGIDNDEREIRIARRYLEGTENCGLAVADAKHMGFEDGSFDVIIILGNTFGNIPHGKEEVLKEAKRLIRDGGRIFIEVNSIGSVRERAQAFSDIGMKVERVEDGRIFMERGFTSECFSRQELEDLFRRFQLKVRFVDINRISHLCLLTR